MCLAIDDFVATHSKLERHVPGNARMLWSLPDLHIFARLQIVHTLATAGIYWRELASWIVFHRFYHVSASLGYRVSFIYAAVSCETRPGLGK
jgi:hypothetical protein